MRVDTHSRRRFDAPQCLDGQQWRIYDSESAEFDRWGKKFSEVDALNLTGSFCHWASFVESDGAPSELYLAR
jgi:hypothetical protein